MEITGSVTGNGWIYIEPGATQVANGATTVIQGAVLQLDSAVSIGQYISFDSYLAAAGVEPALRLLDPGAFDGTIYGFDAIGETLELPGQTITGAIISGLGVNSLLTVTLAAGGPLRFDLSGTPASTYVTVSGSDITVTAAPIDIWTGTADTNFGNAANWDDITDNLDPAAAPPGVSVSAELLTGGGTITGTGLAGQLMFSGAAP